ncbi:MAG: nucleotidyltransferase domain-containing protein [Gammaproteobacteria bacterium]
MRRRASADSQHLQAADCPALRAAHDHSKQLLAAMETRFAAQADTLEGVVTVAVGGSLGRLEAGVDSDIDCIVVIDDAVDDRHADELMRAVQACLAASRLKLPKADGIYRAPIAPRDLLAPGGLGSLEESPAVFGKRMQLLLDARAVHGHARYESLQRAVLDWYASDFIAARASRGWTLLVNDLMRYLHAYAGWQQFKFARSVDDSWQLRQAKLRGSRLLTFAGLLFLLGESDRRADKLDWVAARLCAPPLARVAMIMADSDQAAYARLLGDYETVFAILADPALRARLVATGPDETRRLAAPLDPSFERLRAASAGIATALTRFALARVDHWGLRFFERWLL